MNFWKSKYEDTESIKYTLPRRLKQSQFVADLIQGIIYSDPDANVIVLGDLNDTINSTPLQILGDGGLVNIMRYLNREDRYTYIYQGISQTLDHILVRTNQKVLPIVIAPKHINSDFPYLYSRDDNSSIRSSDHDLVHALFGYFDYSIYLPHILSGD